MGRILLAFCYISLAFTATAQTDTVFFDKDWRATKIRSEMVYFRPTPVKEGDHWKVSDYFINGDLQMIGYFKLDSVSQILNTDQYKHRDGQFKYYKDGFLKSEEEYSMGRKKGVWKYYYNSSNRIMALHKNNDINDTVYIERFHKNGIKMSEGLVYEGNKEGVWKYYDSSNGKIEGFIGFRNDHFHGEHIMYYSNSQIKRREMYSDKVMESGQCFDTSGNEIPYFPYMVMPEAGYDVAKYLSENIRYPKAAKKAKIEGMLKIGFLVDNKGHIKNVKSLTPNEDATLEKEAVRVVSEMPAWIPGKEDGKPVDIHYALPVNFRL